MTHCAASLPAVFIMAATAAAAAVPLCSCWVYQKLSCWVGSQAAHTAAHTLKRPASPAFLTQLTWTVLSGETLMDGKCVASSPAVN